MTTPKSVLVVVNLLLTAVLLAMLLTTRSASADGPNSLTSPNGAYSITVTNFGINLTSPNTKLMLGVNKVTIGKSGTTIEVDQSGVITIDAAALVKVNGALIYLNGHCRPVTGLNGVASVSVPATPGTFVVHGLTASQNVRGC